MGEGGFDPDEVLAEIDALPYIPQHARVAGLSAAARGAADEIVRRNLEAVRAVLASAELDEPACALCLCLPGDDVIEAEERERGVEAPCVLSVGMVTVLAPSGRERLVADFDLEVGPWLGPDYPFSFDVDLRTAEFWALEEQVAREEAALLGAPPPFERGTPRAHIDWTCWPWGWVLERVATALNERPPFETVSDDFVAFFQGSEFDPHPHDLVPLLASPEIVSSLRSRGLLGTSDN